MPRKIHVGPFQPALEAVLADEVSARKKSRGALTPLVIIVPTRLLGLHLQRTLARMLPNGHINLRFRVLEDLLPKARQAPRLGLELLCDEIARNEISANGYFDLATPFFITEYDVAHMDLDPALRGNIQFGYYPSGHMIYLNVDALHQLKDDVAAFITKAQE